MSLRNVDGWEEFCQSLYSPDGTGTFEPTWFQQDVLQGTHSGYTPRGLLAVLAHRQAGLTTALAAVALKEASEGRKVAYIAPTRSLCRPFLSTCVKLYGKPSDCVEYSFTHVTDTYLKTVSGGYISSHTINDLRGQSPDCVILDGAQQITDAVWNAAVPMIKGSAFRKDPVLTVVGGGGRRFSVEEKSNFFRKIFDPSHPYYRLFRKITFTLKDNQNLSPQQKEEIKELSYNDRFFETEYMCEFHGP
jgi:hypothetical protein